MDTVVNRRHLVCIQGSKVEVRNYFNWDAKHIITHEKETEAFLTKKDISSILENENFFRYDRQLIDKDKK